MLRPIYHQLLNLYGFEESDNSKPWYKQKPPQAVLENERAKITWDIPFQLERAPANGANKIDVAVMDKDNKKWILLEGTVCQVGKIQEKTTNKQEKYNDLRQGLKNIYKDTEVTQINIVFDFLGGYNKELQKALGTITSNEKEQDYLIQKCQKWIQSQNTEIVKTFYGFVK